MTFEGRLLTALLSAFSLAALLMGEELVLLSGLLALGAVVASRFLARGNLQGLTARRNLPARARAGVAARVAYEIESRKRQTAMGLTLRDPLAGATTPRRVQLSLPALPPGERVQHLEPVVFSRRGRVRIEGLSLLTRFPLALFEAIGPTSDGDEILVRPREGRPTTRLREALAGRTLAFHRPSLRMRGDEVFHGIREFRDGDDPRRIHWRTTARRGTLTVSEWHREEGREVVVLLGRAPVPGANAVQAFERSVSVAATVLRLAARHGLRTRLLLGTADEERRPTPRNPVRAGLDALALVKGHGGRRPRAMLRRLAQKAGHRVVVYVAAVPESGVRSRLRAAAGPGGTALLLEAHEGSIRQWVRGLQ